MYIKGVPDYSQKGELRETGLFAGLVSQDGELRQTQNGKQYGKASVRAFTRKDGTAAFLSIKTFSKDMALLIANLRKGDRILAAGVVERREYNGKTYTDMLVDFILPGDTFPAPPPNSGLPARGTPYPYDGGSAVGYAVAETGEEDSELPF